MKKETYHWYYQQLTNKLDLFVNIFLTTFQRNRYSIFLFSTADLTAKLDCLCSQLLTVTVVSS